MVECLVEGLGYNIEMFVLLWKAWVISVLNCDCPIIYVNAVETKFKYSIKDAC